MSGRKSASFYQSISMPLFGIVLLKQCHFYVTWSKFKVNLITLFIYVLEYDT